MNDNPESKLSNIIFKSINNKITHIKLDITLPIIELLSTISSCLVEKSNISYEIKFIYSGKVLQHKNSFISYGVKEDHVVLYMLKENETEIKIENNSIIESNLNSISNISNNLENNTNTNNRRGFDRLLDWGTSQTEIYNMRLLFHASYMINNRIENYENREFWTREAIYQREEEWYNNNERNNDSISNSLSRLPIEQSYLRNLLLIRSQRRIRENSVLLVDNASNNQEIINSNLSSERNIMFVIGLIIGFFLRYFVIFYICLCPMKPKLKLGLLFGGLISSVIVLIMTTREREL